MASDYWRAYAEQLEGSLEAKYHRDILGEWISGTLSSRKLIVLIHGLDGESWYWSTVKHDADEAKAEAEREAVQKARSPMMASLYKRVPESKRKAVI